MVKSDGAVMGTAESHDFSVTGLVRCADALARSMELRAAVLLNENSQLRHYSPAVQCFFRDGCLSVCGPLPSFYLKQMVQETLRYLDGVERIDNRITVVNSGEKSRSAFREQVRSPHWSRTANRAK